MCFALIEWGWLDSNQRPTDYEARRSPDSVMDFSPSRPAGPHNRSCWLNAPITNEERSITAESVEDRAQERESCLAGLAFRWRALPSGLIPNGAYHIDRP
jgi:hypothetical protein